MITNLDEAIAHAREVAENLKETASIIPVENEYDKRELAEILDRVENNEQLAAWLEELKQRREADRWISVKERVPEPYVNVLVTGTIQSEPYVSFRTENRWYGDDNLNRNWVIAWRHLPEPYDWRTENE